MSRKNVPYLQALKNTASQAGPQRATTTSTTGSIAPINCLTLGTLVTLLAVAVVVDGQVGRRPNVLRYSHSLEVIAQLDVNDPRSSSNATIARRVAQAARQLLGTNLTTPTFNLWTTSQFDLHHLDSPSGIKPRYRIGHPCTEDWPPSVLNRPPPTQLT